MNKRILGFLWLSLFLCGCIARHVSSTQTSIRPLQTPNPTVSPFPSATPTSIYSTLPVISPSNASQLTEIARLTKGTVVQSLWMPDGKRILVVTKAGVYLYDARTKVELRFFDVGAPAITALSSDGRLMATEKWAVVEIWDIQTGQKLHSLNLIQGEGSNKIEHLFFSPEGHIIAVENSIYGENKEIGPQSRNVQLWDAVSGELIHTFQGRSQPAFRPDNKMLTTFFDGQIEFWKLDDFEREHSVSGSSHSSFSPQSNFIAIGLSQSTSDYSFSVDLLDTRDWSRHCTFDRVHYVPGLEFTSDGKKVATASDPGSVRVWDTATCQLLYSISEHQGCVDSAFSPDGRILATYGTLDRTVKLWDADTGKFLRSISGFYGDLGNFSPDGKLLVEKRWFSGTIALWDVNTGKDVSTFDKHISGPVGAAAFSPDGTSLAFSGHGGTIQLWSVQTGEIQKSFSGISYIKDVVFSPDGKIIGAAGIINQENNEEAKMQWWDVASCSSLYEWQTEFVDKTWMTSASFSPDGKTFAALSIWDNALRLWDTATRQLRYSFVLVDDQSERGMAFSPDSQTIAIATSNRFVKFWDVYTAKQTSQFLVPDDTVQQLVFSNDGHKLFGTGYRTVWVWDVNKKELTTTIGYSGSSIRRIAVSPDGNILAVAGYLGVGNKDGIYLLDVSTQQVLVVQSSISEWIPDLDFSPDGRLLVTAGADGTVRLWGIKP